MAENCTIFCKVADLDQVERILTEYFPETYSSDGTSRTMTHGQGTLRVNSKVYVAGGDDFSNLILQTWSFIKHHPGIDEDVRQPVIKRVASSKMALGVVAEPTFEAGELFETAVFEIATQLDGLVLTGWGILDANTETLIEFNAE